MYFVFSTGTEEYLFEMKKDCFIWNEKGLFSLVLTVCVKAWAGHFEIQ